ncbi:hypothetical protein EYF80_011716 [Liparis tanakae]|uniref:Uncharacterized protein n=1 Tax=Liparis tanakae TaxID=230148 RepID=A0A4Z2IKF5_9TELE|nr:hypothetical protein EYF80_011716 [Liparis tanakae]
MPTLTDGPPHINMRNTFSGGTAAPVLTGSISSISHGVGMMHSVIERSDQKGNASFVTRTSSSGFSWLAGLAAAEQTGGMLSRREIDHF